MTVITMTREMGSLGKDVAAGVADELDLDVIHHEVVERDLADRMKLGESDVHRFLEGKPSLLDRWKIDKDRLSHYTAEEICDFAHQGNVVIRGWGATALLATVPHILRIRVCAPMASRIKVMQDRLALTNENYIRREIERNDAAHTRAMHNLAKGDWESAQHYDLVLNTERIPVKDCIKQVVTLAKSEAFEKTANSQQILNDLVIEHRVHNAIADNEALVVSARNVDIAFAEGEIILTGVIDNHNVGSELCRELKNVPGVKKITDNLTVLPSFRG